jgi:pyrroline-5-carboxylate reductase
MERATIAFIGGGNMARSLIGGLIADGCPSGAIRVSDPDSARLAELRSSFRVNTAETNPEAVAGADALVLAVKPQVLRAVTEELAPTVQAHRPLIISIAAGIRAQDLQRWLGGGSAIVRAMPNTPALVQSGATALYATGAVSGPQRDLAESVLRAVGITVWVEDEAQMDAVTALSGSGPAYFLLVMEALEDAATRLGLPRETARLLTQQTAYGAAKMAMESAETAAALRARVTSPGGTTERAVAVLEQRLLPQIFEEALRAADARSRELASLLGAD